MPIIYRDQPIDPNSRASRKDDLALLMKLGVSIVALPEGQFAKLDIPERLRDVAAEARRLKARDARRRQMLHVQAALDECDLERLKLSLKAVNRLPAPVNAAPAPVTPDAETILALSLLDGGDEAVFAMSGTFDPADLQTLRQAVRRAKKDFQSGRTRDACAAGISQCLKRIGGK